MIAAWEEVDGRRNEEEWFLGKVKEVCDMQGTYYMMPIWFIYIRHNEKPKKDDLYCWCTCRWS